MKEITKDKLLILWGPPFGLLVLLTLSFGLMLPWLGYGFDDLHFIYYSTRGAQGLSEIFNYDGHSQETWLYILVFKMLGRTPLYWHILSLFWRWLAVVSFWACLRMIWPDHHRQVLVIAGLFAVHPIYTLQVFPICFFDGWLAFTLLFLSFCFTNLAIRNPEKRWFYTMVAVALAVGRFFTSEYTWFVELMRPVYIWLSIPGDHPRKKKLVQTALEWIPYFVILAGSVILRGFFILPTRKSFQVPFDLFSNPVKYLLRWSLDLLPDVGSVLVTAWYETFRADFLYFARPFNILLIMVMILTLAIGFFHIRRLEVVSKESEDWSKQAMILGLPSILFGILPLYIASYSLHTSEPPFNSRFTLGMLPGAALLTTAVLETMITKRFLRVLMSVMILSMAMNWHIRYTNDYRKVWAYHSNFLQQLTWRVPALKADTALFVWRPTAPRLDTSNAGISLYGDFPLAMAVNSIYQADPDPADNRLAYWYYALPVEGIEPGSDMHLHTEHATTYFDGNASDGLYFLYDPTNERCLHLIDVDDQYYNRYPDEVRVLARTADTARVLPTPLQNEHVRAELLGDPSRSWCFFYQKADLARQYQQWDEIPGLWREAASAGLQTDFGIEYIPFIDGFAHLADWQNASELTFSAVKLSQGMNSILCPLWDKIERTTTTSADRDETISRVRTSLKCAVP